MGPITSKANTKEYADNYDRIFGKGHKASPTPPKEDPNEIKVGEFDNSNDKVWQQLVDEINSGIYKSVLVGVDSSAGSDLSSHPTNNT